MSEPASGIVLRRYCSGDGPALARLFYRTVHAVCRRDYTPAQLDAWATGEIDAEAWDRSFREHFTLVAEQDGIIVGFGDIDKTGYLDRLYIHKDYQHRGIATALCDRLETAFPAVTVTTHASITAKGFFERRGYRVVREQQVERRGILLTNYVMELRGPKE